VTLAVLRNLILNYVHGTAEMEGHGLFAANPRWMEFTCTRHFLTNYMKRNQLSYRCTRAARRPAINPDEVERYHTELAEIHKTIPWDHIVNADESFWLVLYLPQKTVAPTGIETVKVEIDGDPKAGLTIMGAITAAGTKLPLFLIAKGLTRRCHEQFGDVADRFPAYIAHSRSGWVSQAVFNEYLSFVRLQIPDGQICLVLDQYPTHGTDESEAEAARLGIRLIKVPKGATGIWQPLDRRIYGAMKSKARARWARLFAHSDIPRVTKALAAEFALQCWKELTEDLILAAWDFDEAYADDADDDGADTGDEAFIDMEYGHDDLEEADLELLTMALDDNEE
jgi:hypothetical protein